MDPRIAQDVDFLERFKLMVTPRGDGLTADVRPDPGRGGKWEDVARVAQLARERDDVFGAVAFDGGPGTALTLSWKGDKLFSDPKGGPVVAAPGLAAGAGRLLNLGKGAVKKVGKALGYEAGKKAAKKAGKKAAGEGAEAVGEAALGGALVLALEETLEEHGLRALLFLTLVVIGVTMAGLGGARALGVRSPEPAGSR